MVTIKEVECFKDYGKCLSIDNGIICALVTLDVGPRIISFSFINGTNVMFSDRKALALNDGKEFDEFYYKGAAFENFGGHRIWLSPESLPETYYPDCNPVKYVINGNVVTLTPPPQKENGMALQLELTMHDKKPEMQVKQIAKNISDTEKEYALWALTVMDQGGVEIIPQNTLDTGLLANRRIVLWPYASINDDRFTLGDEYLTLKQQPGAERAFKIGVDCNAGIGYYVLNDVVFSKKYSHNIDGVYPDGGCSYETYTNGVFLEFETLGELKRIAPNNSIEHTELFTLQKKPCELDPKDMQSVKNFVNKLN